MSAAQAGGPGFESPALMQKAGCGSAHLELCCGEGGGTETAGFLELIGWSVGSR